MKSSLLENSIREYLVVVFRRKSVIIITLITVMITVALGLELKTPVYKSSVKMLISARKETASPYYKDLTGGYQSAQMSLTQSEIVYSYAVLERVVRVLKFYECSPGYEENFCSPIKSWVIKLKHMWSNMSKRSKQNSQSPEEKREYAFAMAVASIRECLDISPIRDTDLFTITASDFDPKVAALIANVTSRSYVIFYLEQQFAELQFQYGDKHPRVIQLKSGIDELTKNLSGALLSSIEALGPASVKIIEQAHVPFEPAGSSKKVTVAIAFVMSLFLGIMLAFGFEYIDQTFKSSQDIEAFLNLPVLGTIPKMRKKDTVFLPDIKQTNAYVLAYHNLSDQIFLLIMENKLKSLLITATSPWEGSTAIVANICSYLSEKAGHKVFVIDANLRAPALHKIYGISGNPGLSDILEGKVSLPKAAQHIDKNLTILPAGETSLNPAILLHTEKVVDVIKEAKESSEVVIVDYADLKNIKDIAVLSSHVDGVILVVNEGQTRRHVIKALINPLEQRKSNIIGVILNNRTFAIPKILYRWL